MQTSPPLFEKVVIFGVGLIGGSFALALRQAGQVGELVGFGRTLGSLSQALELGIVDRAGFNIGQEVSNADLVLIATGADRAVPADQAFKVKELVPKGKVIYLRDLGHLAHEERPQMIADLILQEAKSRSLL
jgi:pimeloyl-ACP methyl ester carboxylesterase